MSTRKRKSSGYYHTPAGNEELLDAHRARKQRKKEKGHAKPTGKKPKFARSKSRGDHQVTLESHLHRLLKAIYTKTPEHPMFGPLESGVVRAPYIHHNKSGQEHKAKVSWRKLCSTIAKYAEQAGITNLQDAKTRCWMVSSAGSNHTLQFCESVNKKVVVHRTVSVTRVLCFLKNPSEAMWHWLNESSLEQPFDHWCGRGCAARQGDMKTVCINGLYHGDVSTRADNEHRKKCTFGARALCPGHGPKQTKCIFTHPDGTLQPCRMLPDRVGPCECTGKKCF